MPNACVKLYLNWIINEVARVMIIGEHTYVRTYVHTYVCRVRRYSTIRHLMDIRAKENP